MILETSLLMRAGRCPEAFAAWPALAREAARPWSCGQASSVVAGARAQFKGWGAINGEGEYAF
jgi:hypothetical protein